MFSRRLDYSGDPLKSFILQVLMELSIENCWHTYTPELFDNIINAIFGSPFILDLACVRLRDLPGQLYSRDILREKAKLN